MPLHGGISRLKLNWPTAALDQLRNIFRLPWVEKVRVMPDATPKGRVSGSFGPDEV